MDEMEVKQQVRQFYDRVGWQMVSDGMYQNARYEDLRPVAHEYIHKCHLRVRRYLKPEGRYLLDAGCGPIQYPEYLTYSLGYAYRVCVDISIVALEEARKRIGSNGLFVVADVANLPFKPGVFDGLVTLHTLHHLPSSDQQKAYQELYRVLMPGRSGVVVNGWTESSLMRRSRWLVNLMERLGSGLVHRPDQKLVKAEPQAEPAPAKPDPTGTFIKKLNANSLRQQLQGKMDFEIKVWRSVNVRFLRAVIHKQLGGRFWLKLLYGLEERFPRYFGENGQYPLVIIRKPANSQDANV
ncbi:MAG: class I SAM-dependent methyltransferase [Anaerolineaceae bacterium]|nr:class I SAM-dependent methyltransferase [Anaerolineaceae bacterium]